MSEELPTPTLRARIVRAVAALIVLGLVLSAIGAIGQLSGAGFFGYRTWMYGPGELYALNLGPTPLFVSVDGRDKIEVPAENANVVDLVGGTSTVQVFDAQDTLLASYDITIDGSHAFLKLTDDGCLAVVDITPFYGGKQRARLDFEAFLKPDVRVWIAQSRNVVWPRRDFPAKLEGGEGKGLWFEIVACELFEEVPFLDAYLAARIEGRMATALGKPKPR